MNMLLDWYTHIQALPAVLAGRWIVVLSILLITILFGRLYCRFVCPLGILQSLVRLFRGPRRVCSRLDRVAVAPGGGRVRLIVRLAILAAFLFTLGFAALDPYAICTRAVSVFFLPEVSACEWAFALIPLVLVLVLACFAFGRIWCNWVCPVGTVLSFFSAFAPFGDKVKKCAGCDKCRKCFCC